MTFLVQKYSGAVASIRYIPLASRLGNALISYCRYLGKLFWPVDLAVFYPHPGVGRRRKWCWPGIASGDYGMVYSGAAALSIYADRLAVVCGDIGAGDWVGAGGGSIAGGSVHLYTVNWGVGFGNLGCIRIDAAVAEPGDNIVGGRLWAIILCLGLTRQQLGYWKDSETLFRHALAVTQNNYLMHDNLGLTLGKEGQIDEAIKQFEEALRLKPNFANAYTTLVRP